MKIYQTCRVCKAVYFNKTWHHGDRVKVDDIKRSRFSWTTRCPACKMVESHTFEGLVTITNVPNLTAKELFYIIKGFCNHAYYKNCQHRLIEIIRQDAQTWVITTTDKHMAYALGRRISQAFGYVEVKHNHTEEKSFAQVLVKFVPLFYRQLSFERG